MRDCGRCSKEFRQGLPFCPHCGEHAADDELPGATPSTKRTQPLPSTLKTPAPSREEDEYESAGQILDSDAPPRPPDLPQRSTDALPSESDWSDDAYAETAAALPPVADESLPDHAGLLDLMPDIDNTAAASDDSPHEELLTLLPEKPEPKAPAPPPEPQATTPEPVETADAQTDVEALLGAYLTEQPVSSSAAPARPAAEAASDAEPETSASDLDRLLQSYLRD